ncbi:Transcriptional regulator, LysR family [Labilithrix luteola]|uniref:Transcriptional regulator, LysR family n=1 Tax=Labilithrix luteola TaxID=1391654 RepID=A0A0K1PYB5_9BACT|nr:LysR family transcriptional regulator [Labilithrix luteola]AKU98371.1 Transcriptional regulator, LysR family [Labilithrix luteola]
MDQLEALRAFARVVEAGGFSGAARSAGLSAVSSVTRQLNWLEDKLGVKLLVRSTRSVTPTEAGQVLYEQVTRVLEELDAATRMVSGLDATPRGRLRVTAPVAFGRLHLSRVVTSFMRKCPEVELELVLTDAVVDILEAGIDIAIRIGRPESGSLIARKLAPHQRVVCAAPAYFAAHGRPKHPRDLARHRCLLFSYEASAPGMDSRTTSWHFAHGGTDTRVRVQGTLRANSSEMLLEAAMDGAGVALLPTWLVAQHVADGRLACVLSGFDANPRKSNVAIYALYPQTRRNSVKTRAFVQHVAEHLASQRSWEAVCFKKRKAESAGAHGSS